MIRRLALAPLFALLFLTTNCAIVEPFKNVLETNVSPTEAARMGIISSVRWSENDTGLYYINQDKKYRYDLVTHASEIIKNIPPAPRPTPAADAKKTVKHPAEPRPTRGRQYMAEWSPDGAWRAACTDWNVVLENHDNGTTLPVTTEGNRKFRYGTANWVYGEELYVKHGIWWTPDSQKLVYYVFDERPVQDFYLSLNLTEPHTTLYTEGYTKAGEANPIVWLEIYDLESGKRTPVNVGQETDQYIYHMLWTPGGEELLFNRINRRHKKLEVVALDPKTAKTRVVVTETQETWQENAPKMVFLEDGKRFIWETERTLWKQYELRHLDGRLLNPLSQGEFPVMDVVKVDEKNNGFYYTVRNEQNPLNEQLYRVGLDGKNRHCLTPAPLNHRNFSVSTDGKWALAQAEDINTPPVTLLCSTDGKQQITLADAPKVANPFSEIFTFKADDGKTDIFGILHKPEDFDPAKKYPLVLNVYGGPESGPTVQNTYQLVQRDTERGYLLARVDNRGTRARGKAFMGAVYEKLGQVDIQDQADGMRYLVKTHPYVDGKRIGIVGHSYGGYMSAMGILRHPDVFATAADRAGPTHWAHYDSIYTERWMNLPQDNPKGYEDGSCFPYIENLRGKLLIMHGMVDDNVHPSNAWKLIAALDKAGKTYESRFFPNNGHGFGGNDTVWAFFDRWLQPEVSGQGEK